jgi:hypothetical protein
MEKKRRKVIKLWAEWAKNEPPALPIWLDAIAMDKNFTSIGKVVPHYLQKKPTFSDKIFLTNQIP